MMSPNIYGRSFQEREAIVEFLKSLPEEVSRFAVETALSASLPIADVLEAMAQLQQAFAAEERLVGRAGFFGGLRRCLGRSVRARGASGRWSVRRDRANTRYRVALAFWCSTQDTMTVRNLSWLWRLWGGIGLRIGGRRYWLFYANPRAI